MLWDLGWITFEYEDLVVYSGPRTESECRSLVASCWPHMNSQELAWWWNNVFKAGIFRLVWLTVEMRRVTMLECLKMSCRNDQDSQEPTVNVDHQYRIWLFELPVVIRRHVWITQDEWVFPRWNPRKKDKGLWVLSNPIDLKMIIIVVIRLNCQRLANFDTHLP